MSPGPPGATEPHDHAEFRLVVTRPRGAHRPARRSRRCCVTRSWGRLALWALRPSLLSAGPPRPFRGALLLPHAPPFRREVVGRGVPQLRAASPRPPAPQGPPSRGLEHAATAHADDSHPSLFRPVTASSGHLCPRPTRQSLRRAQTLRCLPSQERLSSDPAARPGLPLASLSSSTAHRLGGCVHFVTQWPHPLRLALVPESPDETALGRSPRNLHDFESSGLFSETYLIPLIW